MGNKSIRRRWLRKRAPLNAKAGAPRGQPITIETALDDVQPLASTMEPRSTSTTCCAPLLAAWPSGYRGFRFEGVDVILFAEDKPPIRFANALSNVGREAIQ
jgi:hypothetical protein